MIPHFCPRKNGDSCLRISGFYRLKRYLRSLSLSYVLPFLCYPAFSISIRFLFCGCFPPCPCSYALFLFESCVPYRLIAVVLRCRVGLSRRICCLLWRFSGVFCSSRSCFSLFCSCGVEFLVIFRCVFIVLSWLGIVFWRFPDWFGMLWMLWCALFQRVFP